MMTELDYSTLETYTDGDWTLRVVAVEGVPHIRVTSNQINLVLDLDKINWLGCALLDLRGDIFRAEREANIPFRGKIGLIRFDETLSVGDARYWLLKATGNWIVSNCVYQGPKVVEDNTDMEIVAQWLVKNPNSPFTFTICNRAEMPAEWEKYA